MNFKVNQAYFMLACSALGYAVGSAFNRPDVGTAIGLSFASYVTFAFS